MSAGAIENEIAVAVADIVKWWVANYEDPLLKIAYLTSGTPEAAAATVDPQSEILTEFPHASAVAVAAAVAEIVGDSCRKWVKRGMIVP